MLIYLDQSKNICEKISQARLGLGKFGRVGLFLKLVLNVNFLVTRYIFFITGVCLEEKVCVSTKLERSWTEEVLIY